MDILTTSEKRAVFILIIVLIGASITHFFYPNIYVSHTSDYSESDSIFSRISYQPSLLNPESVNNTERIRIVKTSQDTLSDKLAGNKNFTVNINSASVVEMQKLPGIGTVLAKRILEYRNCKKKFTSLEELKCVKGIGEKTFQKLKSFIRIK